MRLAVLHPLTSSLSSFYNVSCVILAAAVVVGGAYHHFEFQAFRFVDNSNMMDLRQEGGSNLRFFMWLYYIQK